jgi:hypothetical protein
MTEPLRFSRLKLIAESAQHYLQNVGPKESASLRKGSGIHGYMLGQRDKIAVYEGRRDPRAKAYQQFLADNEGKEVLSRSESGDVLAMRRAIEAHPRAMQLLAGIQERTMDWKFMGRRCAGTPDAFQPGSHLTELKALRTTNPHRCPRDMERLGYAGQLFWYREGLRRNGIDVPECYVVAVANAAPWLVVVYRLTESTLTAGGKCVRAWMERLKASELSGYWPGYSESDVDWDIQEAQNVDDSGLEVEEA